MKKTKIHILAFGQEYIPSVRILALEPLKELCQTENFTYQYLPISQVKKQHVISADILYSVRVFQKEIYEICEKWQKVNQPLISILDDHLLGIPSNINSAKVFQSIKVQNTIKYALMKSSTILLTTPKLKNLYQKYSTNIYQELFPVPYLPEIPNSKINKVPTIGFAGGVDSQKYLNEIIHPALKRLTQISSTKFKFVTIGPKLKTLTGIDYKHINYQRSFSKYRQILTDQNFDLGLAPLPRSTFHQCKHFNKFLEYTALGIAGIYSDCEPYSLIVKNNYNGILTTNHPDSWAYTIKTMLENKSLKKSIVRNANSTANQYFNLKNSAIFLKKVFLNHVSEGVKK